MKCFIARGPRWVAVFTAENEVEAARVGIELIRGAGKTEEGLEVLEFDPSRSGGVLLELVDGTVHEATRVG